MGLLETGNGFQENRWQLFAPGNIILLNIINELQKQGGC
jgi:hypothetical protein